MAKRIAAPTARRAPRYTCLVTDEPGLSANRRRLLTAASLGVLALPIAACAPSSSSDSGSNDSQPPSAAEVHARNVRNFGAVGDGTTDDTVAVAKAFAGDGPVAVYFPTGMYKVSKWPEMRDFCVTFGDGADLSTILYADSGTLVTINDKQRVEFKNLGFYLVGKDSACLEISHAFRCSFDTVLFRGQHTADNYPQHVSQTGIILAQDSGGTTFSNCDINNFGTGLITSCIQNYVTGSRFTTNHVSVLGTGSNFNAGLSMANVEFVSSAAATSFHILIDGPANDWWITNTWFEGCDVAIKVGNPGKGGPSQFGMVNCKVAAKTLAIDLQHCRQPYLANVVFDADRNSSGRELQINAAFCPEGTAISLISSKDSQIDPAVFPPNWNVLGRGSADLAPFVNTIIARGAGAADKFQSLDDGGHVTSSIAGNGEWTARTPGAGIVLRSPNGTFWRLAVLDNGDIVKSDLGKTHA